MIRFVNFFMRIACAIAFGVILMWHDRPETLIMQGAGILFGLSGLLGIAESVIASIRGRRTLVPFAAYGALLAAALMLLQPEVLAPFIPIVLGALLILLCGNQVFTLLSLKFRTNVKFAYFIAPAIVLLYGIFLLFQTHVDVLVGLSFLLFALSEVVVTAAFFKYIYLNRQDPDEDETENNASALPFDVAMPQPASADTAGPKTPPSDAPAAGGRMPDAEGKMPDAGEQRPEQATESR